MIKAFTFQSNTQKECKISKEMILDTKTKRDAPLMSIKIYENQNLLQLERLLPFVIKRSLIRMIVSN